MSENPKLTTWDSLGKITAGVIGLAHMIFQEVPQIFPHLIALGEDLKELAQTPEALKVASEIAAIGGILTAYADKQEKQ